MRFASYEKNGRATYGLASDKGLTSVGGALADRFPTLRSAIEGNALEQVAAELGRAGVDASVDDVRMLPLIPNPDKILCIGLNYEMHRAETGRSEVANPTIFVRFANAQVGHDQPLVRPKVSERFDYEGELAVVIGKRCRHVSEADALSVIAGYSCFNDGSVRDWQGHTTQFTPGKNFFASGSFGPWLVTADEFGDWKQHTLETRLNGEVMQHTSTADMIFQIPRLIAYITTFTELVPGDVIATGTPGGVGSRRQPPVWMKPGDTVEIDVSGIGVLRNEIAAE